MRVYCIIPAWNEVARRSEFALPQVIKELQGKVDNIVLVDDGSDDDTFELSKDLQADILRHPVNRGQGAALKTGTDYALEQGADIIVHFDADGQFRVEDIARVVEPIREGRADIVFGSRFIDNTTKMPYLKEKVIMPLARLVNRLFFKIKTSDPQSGFRALSRRAAKDLQWNHDEMAHCSEILVLAHRSGLPITEVPITVLYPDFGQHFGGGLKILRDMFISKMNH